MSLFEKVSGYAKAHPWTTGALVIGGGLTFILLSGWFKGGGGTTINAIPAAGPSDAVQVAAINAGAAQAQAGTQLQATQIVADLYSHLADLHAQQQTPQQDPNLIYIDGTGYTMPQLDIKFQQDKATAAAAKANGQGVIMTAHLGALQNEVPNAVLASTLHYTGDFGSGGFQQWITHQDVGTQKAAEIILNRFGQQDRIVGF